VDGGTASSGFVSILAAEHQKLSSLVFQVPLLANISRKWLMMLIYNSLTDESAKQQFVQDQITAFDRAAVRHPCNYYAWSYRAEILLPLLLQHNLTAVELQSVISFTAANILDTSAWHYLATLLLHADNEKWWNTEFVRSIQQHQFYHNMKHAVMSMISVGKQKNWITKKQFNCIMIKELKLNKALFN
jgi:hypothetical protein